MLGIIVQLLISWIIAWLVEKKDLSVLGFRPTQKRITWFFLFFCITAAFCASSFLIKMYFADQVWKLNPRLSANLVLTGTWWNLKSVLFEELIFRGVLLYILIRRMGMAKGIIITATAFGIYHWFSFGVIGNPMGMLIAFVTTGAMGLLLAYAYAKTSTLYIPIAIHLGWNFTQIFIFSQGPIGDGLFVPIDPKPFRTGSFFLFFVVTFLPMATALFTNYLILVRLKGFPAIMGASGPKSKEMMADSFN